MEVVEEEIALAVSHAEKRDVPLSFYTVQRWMRVMFRCPAFDDRSGFLYSLRTDWA